MEELWTLLMLSLAMLVGCYLAGSIPLACTLSEDKLKLVSVMGAGLLVGTALAVIIPEGVHTLYIAQGDHAHEHIAHVAEKAVQQAAEKTVVAVGKVAEHVHDHAHGAGHEPGHEHSHEHGHEHGHGTELHTYIGISLVLGFVFMLLVDQLSGGSAHVHGSGAGVEGEPSDGGQVTDHSVDLVDSHSAGDELGGVVPQHRNNVTATLGLVVHAAADGVALGAAATTSQTHVEMIVFIAIMLHKAPAAFGLVSFLLHEGFDRNRIRRHLGVFSAAAPVLAIITYFGLSQQSKEVLSTVNATGVAMLFSAGTFLYVATVHVLPELQSMGTTRTTCADGTVILREQKGFTKLELLLMVVGAMLPLVLSLGHHH